MPRPDRVERPAEYPNADHPQTWLPFFRRQAARGVEPWGWLEWPATSERRGRDHTLWLRAIARAWPLDATLIEWLARHHRLHALGAWAAHAPAGERPRPALWDLVTEEGRAWCVADALDTLGGVLWRDADPRGTVRLVRDERWLSGTDERLHECARGAAAAVMAGPGERETRRGGRRDWLETEFDRLAMLARWPGLPTAALDPLVAVAASAVERGDGHGWRNLGLGLAYTLLDHPNVGAGILAVTGCRGSAVARRVVDHPRLADHPEWRRALGAYLVEHAIDDRPYVASWAALLAVTPAVEQRALGADLVEAIDSWRGTVSGEMRLRMLDRLLKQHGAVVHPTFMAAALASPDRERRERWIRRLGGMRRGAAATR